MRLNELKSIDDAKEESKTGAENKEKNNPSTKIDEEFIISLEKPLAFIWNRDISTIDLTTPAPYGIIPLPNMITMWAATLIDEVEYFYTEVKTYEKKLLSNKLKSGFVRVIVIIDFFKELLIVT